MFECERVIGSGDFDSVRVLAVVLAVVLICILACILTLDSDNVVFLDRNPTSAVVNCDATNIIDSIRILIEYLNDDLKLLRR